MPPFQLYPGERRNRMAPADALTRILGPEAVGPNGKRLPFQWEARYRHYVAIARQVLSNCQEGLERLAEALRPNSGLVIHLAYRGAAARHRALLLERFKPSIPRCPNCTMPCMAGEVCEFCWEEHVDRMVEWETANEMERRGLFAKADAHRRRHPQPFAVAHTRADLALAVLACPHGCPLCAGKGSRLVVGYDLARPGSGDQGSSSVLVRAAPGGRMEVLAERRHGRL